MDTITLLTVYLSLTIFGFATSIQDTYNCTSEVKRMFKIGVSANPVYPSWVGARVYGFPTSRSIVYASFKGKCSPLVQSQSSFVNDEDNSRHGLYDFRKAFDEDLHSRLVQKFVTRDPKCASKQSKIGLVRGSRGKWWVGVFLIQNL